MISYTNINEAWGINKEKETFKNLVEKNIPQVDEHFSYNTSENIPKNNDKNVSSCEAFNHIFSCKECLEKLKNTLDIPRNNFLNTSMNASKNPSKNPSKNTLTNTIEGFSNKIKENKDLSVFIIIVVITILLILLIHSYRKKPVLLNPNLVNPGIPQNIPVTNPIAPPVNSKNFYIFPEEIDKIRALLEIKK